MKHCSKFTFQKICIFPLLLVLTMLCAIASYAQNASSDEWIVPIEKTNARLSTQARQNASYLNDKKYYLNVEYIYLRSIADVQKDGVLSFHVPGDDRKHRAKAQEIRAESKRDYVWNGSITDGTGSMLVVSVDGKIQAHIDYEDKIYEIYPVEDSIHAIVEIAPRDFSEPTCGVDLLPDVTDESSTKPTESPDNGRVETCIPNTVEVLVLTTARARATGISEHSTTGLAIEQINQIQANSQVNGRLRVNTRVVANLNFIESDNINNEANILATNIDAQLLRAQTGADLVVLLTDGNYGAFLGAVRQIGPNNPTSYAIVQIRAATSARVFAHEVAHLFGARHQDCNEWTNDGCDNAGAFQHGYNYTISGGIFTKTKRYHTLMHQLRNDYTQIPYLSNPDVSYGGGRTGTAAHDNTRLIELNDITVANFLPGDQLINPRIEGPTQAQLYHTSYTWEAVVSCGSTYTYRWEVSDDGFTYYYAGNTDRMTRSFYSVPSGGYSTIRLRVTSNSQTVTAYRTVYVQGNARLANTAKDTANWAETAILEDGNDILLEDAYPNPVTKQTRIGFFLPDQQTISLDIVDLNGKIVRGIAGGAFEAGSYEFDIQRESLPKGVYLYQLTAGETKLSKRLLISEE